MSLRDPLLITVAPNGARLTKADHPEVPLTSDEIARTAARCCEAGAAMIHLHVRDRNGLHILDAGIYRDAIAAILRETGDRMIVQITTEAVGMYGRDEQMALVRELRPEAVSLALRELVPDEASEKSFAEFLAWTARERIWPQYILYDSADIARFHALRAQGIIPGPRPFVLLVAGRRDRPALPMDLIGVVPELAEGTCWAVCAFGRAEAACTLTAVALGGHSRIGFENNTRLADGVRAPDNAALVSRMRDGARLLGREPAAGGTARQRFLAGAFD